MINFLVITINITNIEKYLNSIVDYMIRHSFGLTDDEKDYVWYRYKFLMGWNSWDWSQGYLRKILKDY